MQIKSSKASTDRTSDTAGFYCLEEALILIDWMIINKELSFNSSKA